MTRPDRPGNRDNITEYRLFYPHRAGATFGYDQIVYAGFKAHNLTEKLKLELRGWKKTANTSPYIQGNG